MAGSAGGGGSKSASSLWFAKPGRVVLGRSSGRTPGDKLVLCIVLRACRAGWLQGQVWRPSQMGLHFHRGCSPSAPHSLWLQGWCPPCPILPAPRYSGRVSSTQEGRAFCLFFFAARALASRGVPPPASNYWMNDWCSPSSQPSASTPGFMSSHLGHSNSLGSGLRPLDSPTHPGILRKNKQTSQQDLLTQHLMEASSQYSWRSFQPLKGWGFPLSEF